MNWLAIKIVAVLLLMGGSFSAGWYFNNKPPIVETQTKIVEKVVTRTVTERVSSNDGTVTEKTTTETASDTTQKTKVPEPVANSNPPRPNYSVDVRWNLRGLDRNYVPTGFDFGRRLVGPVWNTIGYDWTTKSVTLGLRMDF